MTFAQGYSRRRERKVHSYPESCTKQTFENGREGPEADVTGIDTRVAALFSKVDWLCPWITPCPSPNQVHELSYHRGRVAATRCEVERYLELRTARKATIDHALNMHVL